MKNLLFLFAFLACFAACSKDDDDYGDMPEVPRSLAFADVTDAVALYITAPTSGGEVATRAASGEAGNTLFKITGSGETIKVQFSSEDQENVDQPQVYFIKDLSEKYIYMSYDNVCGYEYYSWYSDGDTTYYNVWRPLWEHTQVIIKKDDGAVFKIESEESSFYHDDSDPYNEHYAYHDLITENTDIQTDYSENVYVYHNYNITKIYTHGKEVFLTQINRDDMGIDWDRWLVDQQGNVLINKNYTRLASGEFTRSPEMAWYDWKVFTVYGDSEGFYRLSSERIDNNYGYRYVNWIQYCQAEAPAMSWKNLKQFDEDGAMNNHRIFSYKEKTIVVVKNEDKYMKLTIYDRNRVEEEVLEDCVLLEGSGSYSDWGYEYYGNTHPCTEKYAYKFTDQQIWRAEIETGKAELLYGYGKEYMIKSIKVKNNIVTCDAFELRRGNDVVMEIYEDKSVHLVESVNNDKIIYLERLN